MSQLNVNTIKNRTGTSGPVLTGLSTVSGSLVVSNDATVSGAATVTGALTAASASFTGNVSVGGTLTYEDVTNVDSVGVVTARLGVNVTGGEIAVGAAFSVGQAGVVTATSFSGDGSGLTGVASTDNINTSTLAQFTGGVGIADSIFHIGDDNTAIRFPGNDTFTVETGGSERLRIDSAGEVGIGTALPGNALHVFKSGDGQTPVFFETGNTTGKLRFYNDSDGWSLDSTGNLRFVSGRTNSGTPERFRLDTNGRMLIGATSAVAGADANGLLQVSQDVGSNTCIIVAENTASSGNLSCFRARLRNHDPDSIFSAFLQCDDSNVAGGSKAVIRSNGGLANFSANNVNLSDRNAKKDITAAAGTWNSIKNWEIVNFRYKKQPDDADLNLGVIAQQIEEISPEMVIIYQQEKEATETEPAQEQRLGVREQQMQWAAIKALQEAMARIETLEARLTALEGS